MKYISVLIQHHAGPTAGVLIVKKSGGPWQFPCGKALGEESAAEAAQRIAQQQLGMAITVGKLAMIGHKKPTDGTVEHIVCGNITHNTHTKCDYHEYYEAVNKWQTEPVSGEYEEFAWVHPSQLGKYGFDGDDANFMAKYDPWINGGTIPDRRMY